MFVRVMKIGARKAVLCYGRNYIYIYACTIRLYIFKERLGKFTVLRHGVRHIHFL